MSDSIKRSKSSPHFLKKINEMKANSYFSGPRAHEQNQNQFDLEFSMVIILRERAREKYQLALMFPILNGVVQSCY